MDEANSSWLTYIAPNCVSAVAILISLYALWKNDLKPFNLVVLPGSPRIRASFVSRICDGTPVERPWWIPHIDVNLALYNSGSRAGIIRDLRFTLVSNSRTMHFYAQSIVDFERYDRAGSHEEVLAATESQWNGLLIQSKSSVSHHIQFTGGQWFSFPSDGFCCYLEVLTDRSKHWQQCGTFSMSFGEFERDHLRKGGSFHLTDCAYRREEPNNQIPDGEEKSD